MKSNIHPIFEQILKPFMPPQNIHRVRKAFVSRSLNFDSWPYWAAVVPGQKTTWHDTEYGARVKVQEWNEDHPNGSMSDYFETSSAQES